MFCVQYFGILDRALIVTMASWIEIPSGCDFTLANLPYGVFGSNSSEPRIGPAIGEYALDLKMLAQDGVFSSIAFDATTLESATLNKYAALGREVHRSVRNFLQDILREDASHGSILRDNPDRIQRVLIPLRDVTMHLLMGIGDSTDFFAGIYHAQNVCSTI